MRALACLLTLLVATSLGRAQELPLTDFSYHESFEAGDDPVRFWVSNGEYETNFKGVTDERAFDGQRSFKLDVTLTSGSYFYWDCPVRVIAEGDLHFSARIYVAEGNSARAGIGVNWIYPPTRHSGCGDFESYEEPADQWRLIEADLDAVGPSRAQGVLNNYVDDATSAEIGICVDRWGIFVRGTPGERAVIYVDDVRIEGRVPEEAAYEAEIQRRWSSFVARWTPRVEVWRQRLDTAAGRIASLPALPAPLAGAAEASRAAIERARTQFDALAGQGYARPQEVTALEADLRAAEMAPTMLERLAAAANTGQALLATPVRAISNARILPTELVVPAEEGGIELAACRGEYESGSFVVLPLRDLTGLQVTATGLTGRAGTIPAEAVDLKLVKVWYQAGRGIHDLRDRILVPELLLNDSDLVRVDEEAQHNYLRSTAEDGTQTYVLASGGIGSTDLEGVRPIDAPTLQPIDLPALRLQQYWVTVRVPDDAGAGEYAGALRLSTADGASAELPLTLTVHDFDLAPAPLTYSVYYRARLNADNEPRIDSESRSEEQYLAEMRDMAAHACLYPTIYQNYDETLLPRALELRAEAGLPPDQLFTLGLSTGAPQTEAEIETLRGRVRDWLAMAERFGYGKTYIYGIDEARGERLVAQRAAWQAVREEGAGTFVACYHGTFEVMGDLLDVAVLAGRPDPEEAAKYHGVGSRAFTYAYPQVGPEEPETFRRNFGLVLWQAGFDGAMDYAYQHGFGHVWNDFDSDRYRDHNFTYPTLNGVVDTVQWEGFREAADDTRYMATLLAAIEACDDAAAKAAAQAWVKSLDPQRDLYEVRAEMVEHIRACLGVR